MLINKLKIQRFRGISGEVNIDLSAPLTIFYAANGTGKTSICDAVEWTLSGRVKRLQTSSQEEIKCVYGIGDTFTEIEMEKEIDRNAHKLLFKRKMHDENGTLTTALYRDDKPCKDLDLLNFIVPEIPTGRKGSQAEWMYSTRFLEGDSLRLLIDEDEDSADARKLIFSNLFGVREFQDTEKRLNSIINKLPALSTLKKDKEKLSKDIDDTKKLIEALAKQESKPHYEAALSFLNEFIKRLSLDLVTEFSEDASEIHQELEIELVNFTKNVEHKNDALAHVKNRYGEFSQQLSQLEILENTLKEKRLNTEKYKFSLEAKTLEHKPLAQQVVNAQKKHSTLVNAKAQLIEDAAQCEYLWSRYSGIEIPIDKNKSKVDALQAALIEINDFFSSLSHRKSLVDELIKSFPTWKNVTSTLKGLEIEIKDINESLQNPEEASPEEQLALLRGQLQEHQQAKTVAIAEVDLLLSSGQKFVHDHPDTTTCPLCEHEYSSNKELLSKINGRFDKLSQTTKHEIDLIAEIQKLTSRVEAHSKNLKHFSQLNTKKTELSNIQSSTEKKLKAIGIDLPSPITASNILEVLEGVNKKSQEEYEKITLVEQLYKEALAAIHDFHTVIEGLNNLIKNNGIANVVPIPEEISSIEMFQNQIKAIEASFDLTIKAIADELNSLKVKEDASAQALKILVEQKEREDASISVEVKNLDSLNAKINSFKEKWGIATNALFAIATNNKSITAENISAASALIDKEFLSLQELKGLLEKAQEYINKGREVEKAEKDKNVHLKTLKEQQESLKQKEGIEKYRQALEKQVDGIKDEVKKFISSQIRPLTNVISTLYLRAQGNRFIHSIDAKTNKDGVLDWIAELDDKGEKLQNMHTLSQGQRQDLALAIFLARARSLGGTFFLDEPFVHLDDLNRVALLDTLRIIVSETRAATPLRIVMTTASNSLVRHLREKFSLVEGTDGSPSVRIYKMNGNPRLGLKMESEDVSSPFNLLKMQ